MTDPDKKRRYNITYKLRKRGFTVDTKNKSILFFIRQLNTVVNDKYALELCNRFGYRFSQNKQLELF